VPRIAIASRAVTAIQMAGLLREWAYWVIAGSRNAVACTPQKHVCVIIDSYWHLARSGCAVYRAADRACLGASSIYRRQMAE